MGTILGGDDKRLTHLGGKNGLKAGDHHILGHPADVALLTVGGIALVGGVEGGQSGEVALLENTHEAVGQVTGVSALEHHVAHIHGIRHIGVFHDTGGIEGIAGSINRRNARLVGGHESIHVTVHAAKIPFLHPSVAPLAVAVALQESTHVLRGSKLLIEGSELIILGGDILCGRSNLIHHILDLAGSVLLEILLMGVVEALDFLVGYHDGGIHGIVGVGSHHETHVSGGVVLCHGVFHLQGVHIGTAGEEGVVLLVETGRTHGVEQVVAKKHQAAGLVGSGVLQELAGGRCGIIAVFVSEDAHGKEQRRNAFADDEVDLLLLAHTYASLFDGRDDKIFIHQVLPGGFAGLTLDILAGSGGTGKHFTNLGEFFHLLVEVRVADAFSIDFADIVLGRSRLDGLDDVGRVHKEE